MNILAKLWAYRPRLCRAAPWPPLTTEKLEKVMKKWFDPTRTKEALYQPSPLMKLVSDRYVYNKEQCEANFSAWIPEDKK